MHILVWTWGLGSWDDRICPFWSNMRFLGQKSLIIHCLVQISVVLYPIKCVGWATWSLYAKLPYQLRTHGSCCSFWYVRKKQCYCQRKWRSFCTGTEEQCNLRWHHQNHLSHLSPSQTNRIHQWQAHECITDASQLLGLKTETRGHCAKPVASASSNGHVAAKMLCLSSNWVNFPAEIQCLFDGLSASSVHKEISVINEYKLNQHKIWFCTVAYTTIRVDSWHTCNRSHTAEQIC